MSPCQVYVFLVKTRPPSWASVAGPSGFLPSRLSASWTVKSSLSSSLIREFSAFTAALYPRFAEYSSQPKASTARRTTRPTTCRTGEIGFLDEGALAVSLGPDESVLLVSVELGLDMAIPLR